MRDVKEEKNCTKEERMKTCAMKRGEKPAKEEERRKRCRWMKRQRGPLCSVRFEYNEPGTFTEGQAPKPPFSYLIFTRNDDKAFWTTANQSVNANPSSMSRDKATNQVFFKRS